MKNAQHATLEFEQKLNEILLNIRQAAESQFKYDLKNNIPNGISGISFENVANHSIESGVVNAIGKFIKWEPDNAILWAHHILEDNNVVDVAREFWAKYIEVEKQS